MGKPAHETRRRSVLTVLDAIHLDAILFTSLENIRYLCGFSGSDGALLLTATDTFFLTDSRYWTQADEEVNAAQIIHYQKKMDGIASLVSGPQVETDRPGIAFCDAVGPSVPFGETWQRNRTDPPGR